MKFGAYKTALGSRLEEPLPGLNAQLDMAPSGRISPNYQAEPRDARPSAVLLGLFPEGGELKIPIIRRIVDGRTHSGQLALPGGRRENNEDYPVQTALREAEEEIGIRASDVEVAGSLTPLFIPVSNSSIRPVVGFLDERPRFHPETREVDEILIMAVRDLSGNVSEQIFETVHGTIRAPCYVVGDHTIWGATAMILSEFLAVHRELGPIGQ